jgi:hypothetical protein
MRVAVVPVPVRTGVVGWADGRLPVPFVTVGSA